VNAGIGESKLSEVLKASGASEVNKKSFE
jgi:hypothetical protein